jgi:hypothetical protein
MKTITITIFILLSFRAHAQELFVVTEPASNMPASSVAIRVAQSYMKEKFTTGYNYHIMPEVMWGVNKKLMLHVASFISNRNGNLFGEGGSLYAKYRFYSADDIHEHFRLAAFMRNSINRADIHQEEINTMGHNTGFEVGTIATKLINKIAISASTSYEQAMNNTSKNKFPTTASNSAGNYTLSFGKLIYPKSYTSLKQTNINVMLEFVGQTLLQNRKSFLDVIPSVQFIINSQARIDIAYMKEIYSNMLRTAPNGIYLKLEYSFFNVTK